uniref:Uncharacterized protein n=1 Tax=Panagrellus redivivus TaxID=6233 RepID=A0A7E4V2R2_PANRE
MESWFGTKSLNTPLLIGSRRPLNTFLVVSCVRLDASPFSVRVPSWTTTLCTSTPKPPKNLVIMYSMIKARIDGCQH